MSYSHGTPEQKRFTSEILRAKFFIFVQTGGLMILLTSIKPFFGFHHFPALIILALSIVYDRWSNASKKARRSIVYSILLLGLWVGSNLISNWIEATPPLTEVARKLGIVGHVLIMVGVFQAAKEIRLMDG